MAWGVAAGVAGEARPTSSLAGTSRFACFANRRRSFRESLRRKKVVRVPAMWSRRFTTPEVVVVVVAEASEAGGGDFKSLTVTLATEVVRR